MNQLKTKDKVLLVVIVILVMIITHDLSKSISVFFTGISIMTYLAYLMKARRLSKRLYYRLKSLIKYVGIATIILIILFYFI